MVFFVVVALETVKTNKNRQIFEKRDPGQGYKNWPVKEGSGRGVKTYFTLPSKRYAYEPALGMGFKKGEWSKRLRRFSKNVRFSKIRIGIFIYFFKFYADYRF